MESKEVKSGVTDIVLEEQTVETQPDNLFEEFNLDDIEVIESKVFA